MSRRRSRSRSTTRSPSLRVGFYLVYISLFTLAWIFAILYFGSALQHAPTSELSEPFKLNQYQTAIITAIFYAVLGILAVLIVIADLIFEKTGKWFMDIPLDTITFRNARWWEVPVGFFIAIVLLIYSATTHSLLIPLPFATSAGPAPFADGTPPEAPKVLASPLAQASLTALAGPVENATLVNFPIATITSLLVYLFLRKATNKIIDKKGVALYYALLIPVCLLAGYIAIKAHSLIYPPAVMQTTSVSTFLFFSLGGLISGWRRSTLLWDTCHFTYNFGAILFNIVILSISVFV